MEKEYSQKAVQLATNYGKAGFLFGSRNHEKRMKPIHALLHEECDPVTYGETLEIILDAATGEEEQNGFVSYRMAAAYYRGDYQGVIQILRNVGLPGLKFVQEYLAGFYFVAASFYHLDKVEEAKLAYSVNTKVLEFPGLDDSFSKLAVSYLASLNRLCYIRDGEWDLLEEALAELKPRLNTPLKHLTYHYQMARLEAGRGSAAAAQEHIGYVKKHGGTTYYRDALKKALETDRKAT